MPSVLRAAKSYAALLGSILTTLLGLDVIPTGSWRTGLTIASAVCTAIAVYAVPNRKEESWAGISTPRSPSSEDS